MTINISTIRSRLRAFADDRTASPQVKARSRAGLHALDHYDWEAAAWALHGLSISVGDWLLDEIAGDARSHGVSHIARSLKAISAGRQPPRIPVRSPDEMAAARLIQIQGGAAWTSADLATYLGVTRGTVTGYRSGWHRIPGPVVRAMEDVERALELVDG